MGGDSGAVAVVIDEAVVGSLSRLIDPRGHQAVDQQLHEKRQRLRAIVINQIDVAMEGGIDDGVRLFYS